MHIPPNLHFYIPDKIPTNNQINKFIKWVIHARLYNYYIWLPCDSLSVYWRAITKGLVEHGFISGLSDTTLQPSLHDPIMIVRSRVYGDLIIHIRNIHSIEQRTIPDIIQHNQQFWMNQRGATNFYRLWVLYEFGGIFIDLDTKPAGTVPANIDAPRNILFHTLKGTFPPVFTSTIVAATKHAQSVHQLMRLLHTRYESEYAIPRDEHQSPMLTPLGQDRQRRLQELEHELTIRRHRFNWREKKRKRKIQQEILSLKQQRMADKADSNIINYWIEHLMHIHYDPMPLQAHITYGLADVPPVSYFDPETEAILREEHRGMDYTKDNISRFRAPISVQEGGLGVHPHDFKIGPSGYINEDAEHYLYSLEMQAGTELITTVDDDYVLL